MTMRLSKLFGMDIYTADVSGSQLNGLSPINSKEINKKYNEGPIAFSPNGNEAYITVNNYNAVSASGVRLLSLFIVIGKIEFHFIQTPQ